MPIPEADRGVAIAAIVSNSLIITRNKQGFPQNLYIKQKPVTTQETGNKVKNKQKQKEYSYEKVTIHPGIYRHTHHISANYGAEASPDLHPYAF